MPNPLAVGLFQLPQDAASSLQRRIKTQIAQRADREGYALLETFAAGDSAHGLDDTLAAIQALAEHHDLHALVVSGRLDRAKLEGLARSTTLVILTINEPDD